MEEEKRQCGYFLERKKRNCRMTVRKGENFCGEHALERVACPLDPKHTVDKQKLKKHILKCPSRPPDDPEPYYSKNVNASTDEDIPEISIHDVNDDVILDLICRVKSIKISVRKDIRSHSAVCRDIGSQKHILQNASILSHLQRCEDISDSIFVEFGSGRGELTYWLTKTNPNKKYFLVDKASQRRKFDNKLKNEDDSICVRRIRTDIADLVLGKIDEAKAVVGLSKHLCGAATDLALRCLSSSSSKVKGVIIALCCHHRCSWSSYAGKTFYKKHFEPNEFYLIRGLTSWATCGTDKSKETINEGKPQRFKFSIEEKEEIGRMAKRILDFGRLEYLRERVPHLSTTELIQYTESDISLENVMLFASK
ncbi:tRNA:m(4)X modification enzyme TRM13 homolog [Lepeophtheirus salmonis]|uniref:tRNA:m(4)X modification enzyme TRM13 homolog n=1 Tax=Lepeophtheirus salmonis TaxID=72036 RepID=UPI001AE5D3A5|nr:tRNA:m(4)X modification enzyme TRM13 homolog [Lepeophtheirus salmonis]